MIISPCARENPAFTPQEFPIDASLRKRYNEQCVYIESDRKDELI